MSQYLFGETVVEAPELTLTVPKSESILGPGFNQMMVFSALAVGGLLLGKAVLGRKLRWFEVGTVALGAHLIARGGLGVGY